MTKLSQPPRMPRSKGDEDEDRYSREALRLVEMLGAIVVRPGDVFDLSKTPQRAAVFWPGDHGVVNVNVEGSKLLLMPGARLQRLVCNFDCEVSGGEIRRMSDTSPTGALVDVLARARVTLAGVRIRSDTTGASLVSVAAAAALLASGCVFHKSDAGVFFSVAAGGKMVCSAARYGPASSTATLVIDNAGAAVDVCTTGNNDTLVGHANATVLFEA